MDLDNPVIAKLFDRAYGEKLAKAKEEMARDMALENQRLLMEAEARAELARREAETRAEAVRREAEARAEVEAARQWQEIALSRRRWL
ncbi:MAG: hypothetical protein R3C14_24210 [Caldilineaceae bacterium]